MDMGQRDAHYIIAIVLLFLVAWALLGIEFAIAGQLFGMLFAAVLHITERLNRKL